MAVSNNITITPDELQRQAVELNEISSNISEIQKNIHQTLTNTNLHWSKNISSSFVTKITGINQSMSNLIELLDSSSQAAINASKTFSSIDSQLKKLVDGESVELKGSPSTPNSKKNNPKDSPKNTLGELYELYESLPQEYQELIDMIIGSYTNSEVKKILKLIMKMSAGKTSLKDTWDIIEVIGGVSTSALPGVINPWKLIFTTVKTVGTDFTEYKDGYLRFKFADGNFFQQIITEGKILTDVSCRLIDDTFKISVINTAVKIISNGKIDAGKWFNQEASNMNAVWDSISDGSFFKQGAKSVVESYNLIKGLFKK